MDNTSSVRALRETTQPSGEPETADLADGVLAAESQDAADDAVPGNDEPQHDDGEQEKPATGAYALKLPEGLPAHEIPDGYDTHLASFAAAAAAAGIEAKIAQRIVDEMVDASLDLRYQGDLGSQWARDEADTFLRSHFGSDYDRQMALCRRAVKQLGIAAFLDETGWGNSPAVIQTLARYGEGSLTLTKAEAEKRLQKIMTNKDHPYWRGSSQSQKERKAITAEVRRLGAIANEDDQPRSGQPSTGREYLDFKRKQGATSDPRAKAQAMLRDKSHALNNKNAPGHDAAVKQFHELTARISK